MGKDGIDSLGLQLTSDDRENLLAFVDLAVPALTRAMADSKKLPTEHLIKLINISLADIGTQLKRQNFACAITGKQFLCGSTNHLSPVISLNPADGFQLVALMTTVAQTKPRVRITRHRLFNPQSSRSYNTAKLLADAICTHCAGIRAPLVFRIKGRTFSSGEDHSIITGYIIKGAKNILPMIRVVGETIEVSHFISKQGAHLQAITGILADPNNQVLTAITNHLDCVLEKIGIK